MEDFLSTALAVLFKYGASPADDERPKQEVFRLNMSKVQPPHSNIWPPQPPG
jgi:hypothetical protein